MRIHLIALGGAVMHNIAIALQNNNHIVTGSDDEIYEPSRSRLASKGLLPQKMGWDTDHITSDIDLVILGMHARPDNPELQRAKELQIKILSFPEFVYEHAQHKKRVVVAGSHGKTTTTSMILHVLKTQNIDFDYLVGAQLDGFDTMVRFSDAPIMVIEGDEYLSSPIDRRPKFLHYKPNIAIITGIAWDHINVFTTFENYTEQFELFVQTMEANGTLITYHSDNILNKIVEEHATCKSIKYDGFDFIQKGNETFILDQHSNQYPIQVFGQHNLQNLQAAFYACLELGISQQAFFESITSFAGAQKRLQKLVETNDMVVYQDFAHAPSKVKATVDAMKDWYPNRPLIAFLELHTFSSLNKAFLPHYNKTMDAADIAFVYYNTHTLEMKKLPMIDKTDIQEHFHHSNLVVLNELDDFKNTVLTNFTKGSNVLFMSSGNFGGQDLLSIADKLVQLNKNGK